MPSLPPHKVSGAGNLLSSDMWATGTGEWPFHAQINIDGHSQWQSGNYHPDDSLILSTLCNSL